MIAVAPAMKGTAASLRADGDGVLSACRSPEAASLLSKCRGILAAELEARASPTFRSSAVFWWSDHR